MSKMKSLYQEMEELNGWKEADEYYQERNFKKSQIIENPYFIAEISYDEGLDMATQSLQRFKLEQLIEDLKRLMERRENSELMWAAHINSNGDETDIKQKILKGLK